MKILKQIYEHIKYNIPNLFKNIKLFLPVLWNYRSWDYYGILTFLQISIKDIRHEIIETDRHIHSKKYFRDIDTALHCLDRYVADEYSDEFYKQGPHQGWCQCKYNDYTISMTTESKLNNLHLMHSIPVSLDTKNSSDDSYGGPQWGMCIHNIKIANQLEQDDWNMFCDIFKKQLRRWWA